MEKSKQIIIENFQVQDGKVIISSEELIQAMINNNLDINSEEHNIGLNTCDISCGIKG